MRKETGELPGCGDQSKSRSYPYSRMLRFALFAITLIVPSTGDASPQLRPLLDRSAVESSLLEHSARPQSANDVWIDLRDGVSNTVSDAGYIYTSPLRLNRRSALWLGGIVSVGALIFAYDREIYDALKRNERIQPYESVRNTGEFFEPLGFQGNTNQYLIGSYVLGYVTGIELLKEIPGEILTSFLVLTVGKRLTNEVAGRRGPKVGKGARSFVFADGRSFPSGHSITIMTISRVLTHHVQNRPFQYATLGMAGTVLLQRITSDAHWPSDVFFGATFGWVVTDALLGRRMKRSIPISPTLLDDGRTLGVALKFTF